MINDQLVYYLVHALDGMVTQGKIIIKLLEVIEAMHKEKQSNEAV